MKCSTTEALDAQIVPGEKVDLHTSHLFSEFLLLESRDFWRGQTEEQQGKALWRWAVKERGLPGITWVCVESLCSAGNPPCHRHNPHQYYKVFSCSTSLSAAAKIPSEKTACLSEPCNIKVHFHSTHTAQEKGGQVLAPHLRMTDLNEQTVLGACLALIFRYSVNFSYWLYIWYFIGFSFLNVKWHFFFISKVWFC